MCRASRNFNRKKKERVVKERVVKERVVKERVVEERVVKERVVKERVVEAREGRRSADHAVNNKDLMWQNPQESESCIRLHSKLSHSGRGVIFLAYANFESRCTRLVLTLSRGLWRRVTMMLTANWMGR
jgi:hypothetical protein